MHTNRLVVLTGLVVTLLLIGSVVVVRTLLDDGSGGGGDDVEHAGSASDGPDRTVAPLIGDQRLPAVSDDVRPPVPGQWVGGPGGVPSTSWWSSAAVGPGAMGVWPQPLALRITEQGGLELANPGRRVADDGSSDAPFIPALFVDPDGTTTTEVVGSGPLHVTIGLAAADHRSELTLVQGSPVVEVEADAPVVLRAPGVVAPTDGSSGRPEPDPAQVVQTAEGPWAIATDGGTVSVGADRVTITPGDGGRAVVGPVPTGAGAEDSTDHLARLAALVRSPLESTEEDLSVSDDGTTTQVLRQVRAGDEVDASLWALQPHHQRYRVDAGAPVGSLPSALGAAPVVVGDELVVRYPAVPVLWSAVPVPGGVDLASSDREVTAEGSGSYFGGKAVQAAASRADALAASGDADGAQDARRRARVLLDDLVHPDRPPDLRWDDRWGSVVVEPAEFGAGTELNDHHLQYGYWVAAASYVVEEDPTALDVYRDVIDLLVADYAGAAAVPDASTSLPAERTWSPFEGHGWASGTALFAAGNNLESSSESAFAWWAAARWFLATDRPAVAETFLARFTIETWVGGTSWLPTGDQLPSEPSARPWSGVVWGGKVDLTTWFDPAHESALGIQLLPVGPAALARYGTADSIAAAEDRWAWCDAHAGGCGRRWANLLDSDAAVAGRTQRSGPDPEPSTAPLLSAWWRDLWERTSPVEGWSCTPGAVVRRRDDGSTVVLASNPGAPTALRCTDEAGAVRWTATVDGPTAVVLDEG